MNHDVYDDSYIRGILNTVKTIAMVGASAKDNRPSYFAFKYLGERGYNMIPINPGLGGKELLGRKIYLDLHVRIAKEWQRDPKQLRRLGF